MKKSKDTEENDDTSKNDETNKDNTTSFSTDRHNEQENTDQ